MQSPSKCQSRLKRPFSYALGSRHKRSLRLLFRSVAIVLFLCVAPSRLDHCQRHRHRVEMSVNSIIKGNDTQWFNYQRVIPAASFVLRRLTNLRPLEFSHGD